MWNVPMHVDNHNNYDYEEEEEIIKSSIKPVTEQSMARQQHNSSM